VVWLEVHARDSDPSILDHAWDSAGVGQWVLLGRDGAARLVHLSRPGALDERAVFEMTGQPRIVGVAPNDKAIVVAMYAADGAPPALLRIDPSTGAVVRIERADGLSYFAGWAAAP
jgi:hypothetical protein